MKLFGFKVKTPLYWRIYIVAALVLVTAVLVINVLISQRLVDYEASQSKYEAQRVVAAKFPGETGFTYIKTTNVYETVKGAAVYVVKKDGVPYVKVVLAPEGKMWKEYSVTMIDTSTPTPPPPPSPSPTVPVSPTPEPIVYSPELREEHGAYAVKAIETFSERSRNKKTKAQTLVYYEPGTPIYKLVDSLSPGYTQEYDSYVFEDETADEFIDLGDGSFSCRVRFAYRMKKAGAGDVLDRVDYTVYFRANAKGAFLIYAQYLTNGEPSAIPPRVSPTNEIRAEIGGNRNANLTDNNYRTKAAVKAGQTIKLTSAAPSEFIYLVWDVSPTDGFLHELIRPESPVREYEIAIPKDAVLCDAYMLGSGDLPDWVEDWKPALTRAELLLFPTHSDDEHLFFGGVMPRYAGQEGRAVQVVYLTEHDQMYRRHERLNGLWVAGIRNYPVIGPFPDDYATLQSVENAERIFGRENVQEFLTEMIRRFKPEVIVAHDLKGEYGHGAHIINATALAEIIDRTADRTFFPESARKWGAWNVKKTYMHLYAENQIVFDWNTPLSNFGGKTAFEVATAAYKKHVSQQPYFTVRQDGTWQDCRKFGLYRTTVGEDIAKDDLFENIPK